MNIVLWVLQVLLGAAFTFGGVEKFFAYDTMQHQYAWVKDVSPTLVAFIGICEMLGGIGLILPSVTRVMPKLTPLAAVGLATVIILAAGFHTLRGEMKEAILPVVVLGIPLVFIAYGRFTLKPIQPKKS